MTSVASATVWAASLATQGYLVTAPNLIGHASRVSPDYHLSSITNDLRPYLEARTYSLIIGHSLGGVAALHLLPYLPRSHPTAIILVDPPLYVTQERLAYADPRVFVDGHVNVKPAETFCAENPLWTREDGIYRELGTCLCAVDMSIVIQNQPWYYLDRLNDVSEKWEMSVLLADPSILKLCPVEDLHPYPHVHFVVVPGAGHWIQADFPDVVVEEALKRVAELEVA